MGRVKKNREKDSEHSKKRLVRVAFGGNPNVGKSTLFNMLTGLHRHTGNWTGKTVDVAVAEVEAKEHILSVADIPGTYSLLAHSREEEVARNYICFGGADITAIVCDATALERNLALVFQIMESGARCIVILNLMDEAERLGIKIRTDALSDILGVPVIGTVARSKRSVKKLVEKIEDYVSQPYTYCDPSVAYPTAVTNAASMVEGALLKYDTGGVSRFWLAMRLIEGDESLRGEIYSYLGVNEADKELSDAVLTAGKYLFERGIDSEGFKDAVVGAIVKKAEMTAEYVCESASRERRSREIKLDKIFTGRFTAFPVMLLLFAFVLWLTVSFANYPSMLLSRLFFFIEEKLLFLLSEMHFPKILTEAFVLGVFRTLSRVVAVMLPPMVIFFPLFTLLEDSGYLPRVAYNLDRPFACSGACGKQALTMCMGFGCNAVGVSGARIIDSERERLLAILTNSFVPCNGRLPMLSSIIAAAFLLIGSKAPSYLVAFYMLCFIILGIIMTFLVTFLLSKTILKGERSSFTIELPPYRKPEFFRVILRSLTTRVWAVLLRAVAVAVPMGLVIFILSNIFIGDVSLVALVSDFLDPVGRLMGMDGVILLAFILGIPANEIVIPIILMIYTAGGYVPAEASISSMTEIFSANGWSVLTCISVAIFSLFHWPCSTTLLTVYKETGSKKYTVLSFILPTLCGFLLCVIFNFLFGLVF